MTATGWFDTSGMPTRYITRHVPHEPRIAMCAGAYQKMVTYARLCDTEINGFATVEVVDDTFTIRNVCITSQEVSGGHATADPDELHRLLVECVQNGIDPSTLRCQWHSHAAMPSYFSAMDEESIEGWTGDFLVSIVVNHRSDVAVRLDLFRPFRMAWDNLRLIPLFDAPDEDLVASCAADIEAMVTERHEGLADIVANLIDSTEEGEDIDGLPKTA